MFDVGHKPEKKSLRFRVFGREGIYTRPVTRYPLAIRVAAKQPRSALIRRHAFLKLLDDVTIKSNI